MAIVSKRYIRHIRVPMMKGFEVVATPMEFAPSVVGYSTPETSNIIIIHVAYISTIYFYAHYLIIIMTLLRLFVDGAVVKATYTSHTAWISSVAWSPTNEYHFISGSYDSLLKLWDTRK